MAGSMRCNECRHAFHHGAFFLHDLLAGNGKRLPRSPANLRDCASLAAKQVASVIRGEARDLLRIERAGEVADEFQQLLEPLVFDDEIAEPARLEELFDVCRELCEERGELGVVFTCDVGLEPHLENAEHLLF